MLLNSIFTEDI